MNILEQTEALKDLPDQALIKEMQMPTGMAPPVFITAELKRRQRMRDEFKRREAQNMPTVAEEVVMAAGMPQGGIADAARAMAPKSSIAQNTGMNEMMPAAATRAPQRMAEGGIVRMAKGGKTQVVYNGVGYFVYADGDVQDAAGRAVNPELADKIKSSAGVGAEAFGSQPRYDADQLPFKDDGLTYGATVLSAADTGVDPFGVPQMMTSEDRDSSRMREAPAGDTSPSITNVSPVLEDVMGRELGPPTPQQFSSMDMVPSFDVGKLNTVTDPEAMPASEQLPTRPRSLEPIYSETAYPEFSESTYEQGLESTPDAGEMQRPALPAIGSDPRISGNTEVGILPRGLQDLRSPQVDLDLVSESSDGPSKMEQMMQSRSVADNQGRPMGDAAAALAAMTGQAGSSGGVRDFDPYAPLGQERAARAVLAQQASDFVDDDIAPFEVSEIADTTVKRGDRRDSGPSEVINPFEGLFTKTTRTSNKRRGEVEGPPVSLTPTSFSPDPEALPLDDSVVDMTAPELPPTLTDERGILAAALDRGDPAIERGIASSLAQRVPAKNVVTAPTIDDGGDKKPTTPSVTGTGSSPLRDRISRMLDEREASKDADKWMALAQTGLALMASKNPTIGGAIGEAGLVGVGALQKAKSNYDKDILSLLGMQEDMRVADLNYAAKVAKANKPTTAKVGDYSTGAIRFLEAANEVRGTEKVTDDMGQTSEVPKPLSKLTEDERREYDKLMSDYYSFLNSIKTKLPTTVDVTT